MSELVHKAESFKIIGVCMEVHRQLGKGHNEIIYKDALEHEFQRASIPFAREMEFRVQYKEIILAHKYFADFIVFGNILLEVKAVEALTNSHIKQVLNYLAASKLRLRLLANFGEDSLAHKRVVL